MNSLQRAAFRRKVIYLAVILGLFTISMFWRGTLDIPLRGSVAAADRVAAHSILNQAVGLELREIDQGEPELEGEARRLMLLGSKGFMVTYLWQSAIEKQKRNDFHEMEALIQKITQLQPHFITPWIFQSWNIAYNVSVEMQGSGDMYYYIARGIELLAEGERRQGRTDPETGRRLGSPDMRWNIGFYYRNKFGVSDTVEVLRCLYQLSCISPDERDPKTLTNADGSVNLEKFAEFCAKHPHLVRRLRGDSRSAYDNATDEQAKRRYSESLKCQTPESIIQFLQDNRDVPTRYKSAQQLDDPEKQFPSLPPKFAEGEGEYNPGSITKDDFSAYHAARAWYRYSTVPIPPNERDENGKAYPLLTPRAGNRLGEYDPVKYRVPRQPMLIIFLQDGPRTQSYQGEMEQKEGWFDDEGWRIDNPKDQPQNWWFPNDPDRPTAPKDIVVGGHDLPTSLDEWRKALQMWETEGSETGQILTQEQLLGYEATAKHRPPGVSGEPTPDQMEKPEIRRWFMASIARQTYDRNQQVTNFQFFLKSARGEAQETTMRARKILWQAEQQRKLGQKPDAIRLYKQGLELWKDVLLRNKDFHRPGLSDHTDEETYNYELSYQWLLVQTQEVENRAKELANQADTLFRLLPAPFGGVWVKDKSPLSNPGAREVLEDLKWYVVENDPDFSPFAGVMKTNDERNGSPWIRNDVKDRVRENQGLQRKTQPAQP